MAFSPDIIDQVRTASDIVQVVGERVPLKKAGASYKGLCPFHNEKSPSFNVVPSKQIFHCFGCGEGGDVFAFIQKIDKIGFTEALKALAGRAGIELPEPAVSEDQRREAEARKREEDAQVRLLELAAAWFHRNLEEGGEGKVALAYAEGRGLDPAARERFQLGYAPADGRTLVAAAQKKGFSEAEILAAGLAIRNERGLYARFRGRLMFPIHDPKGRLCGFGGRILGPGEPKYLNSPEGLLFNKSKLLYPWPQAKEALGKQRSALVCEGYMDAIACHQAGVGIAVATLGTALTEEHAKLLKRYVDRVVLVFDADAAGLRAARKAAAPLIHSGLESRVIRLKGAKDPDEFLRKFGADALNELIQNANQDGEDILSYAVSAAVDLEGGRPSPNKKIEILRSVFPLVAALQSDLARSDALRSACRILVWENFEQVIQDYTVWRLSGQKFDDEGEEDFEPKAAVLSPKAGEPKIESRPPEALILVERELLALMVAHPELVEEAKHDLEGAQLCLPALRAAVQLLWRAPRGVVMLLEDDGSEEFKAGEALLADLSQRRLPQLAAPAESLYELVRRRQELIIKQEVALRKGALRQENDPQRATALLTEIQRFEQAIQDLRRERHDRGLARPEERA